MVDVSIIIPTKDRPDMLKQCLESIKENTSDVNYEIILVDNGSTDPSVLDFYKQNQYNFDLFTVTQCPSAFHFAQLCNQGASLAKGKFLMFLNNDTIATKGWLSELIKTYNQMNFIDKIGCVGSKLLFPDGRIQHIGQMLRYHDKVPTHLYYGRNADDPKVREASEVQRRVVGITAACMLVTKKAFDEVSGFDPAYINGFEDVDFNFKLKDKGYIHYYCPKSVLYHIEHGTLKLDAERDNKNLLLFFQKWGNKLKKVEQP